MDNAVLYVILWILVIVFYLLFLYGYIAAGYYLGKYIARHKTEIPKFTLICLYIAGVLGWLVVFLIGRFWKKYDKQGKEI